MKPRKQALKTRVGNIVEATPFFRHDRPEGVPLIIVEPLTPGCNNLGVLCAVAHLKLRLDAFHHPNSVLSIDIQRFE